MRTNDRRRETLGLRYLRSPGPIAPDLTWRGGRLLHPYRHHRNGLGRILEEPRETPISSNRVIVGNFLTSEKPNPLTSNRVPYGDRRPMKHHTRHAIMSFHLDGVSSPGTDSHSVPGDENSSGRCLVDQDATTLEDRHIATRTPMHPISTRTGRKRVAPEEHRNVFDAGASRLIDDVILR